MVIRCYVNWGFWKRVVLDCHPICTQLVEFNQSVIHGFTHTDRFVEDYDCGLPYLRILIYCGYLNYWHCQYGLVCVSVWCNATFLARKMHDNAVGSANNYFLVWIQIHCVVDHWSSALVQYLPFTSLKSRYIVPRRCMNPRNALQSAISPCCASRCDE